MRNLIIIVICCIGLVVAAVMAQEAKPAVVGTTANCARLEQDTKTGVWRAWITVDEKHAIIAKFKQAPTDADIKAVRDKTIAQEAEAKAAADAAALAVTTAEALKAAGKCPCCGQALPKVEDTK